LRQLYNITAPLEIGAQNVTITLASLAADMPEEEATQAVIELDTDDSLARVQAGGSLTLSGVRIRRSENAEARRRRRRLDSGVNASEPMPLVSNAGGSLRIDGCELRSLGSVAIHSDAGEIAIASSAISGRVYAAAGRVSLQKSSFADASPLVMTAPAAQLVVGPGNAFNFSEDSAMHEVPFTLHLLHLTSTSYRTTRFTSPHLLASHRICACPGSCSTPRHSCTPATPRVAANL
jgi:hypothetical protein